MRIHICYAVLNSLTQLATALRELFPQERVNNATQMTIAPQRMVKSWPSVLADGTQRKTGTATSCLVMKSGSKSETTSLNTLQQQEIPATLMRAGSLAMPQGFIIDGCVQNWGLRTIHCLSMRALCHAWITYMPICQFSQIYTNTAQLTLIKWVLNLVLLVWLC